MMRESAPTGPRRKSAMGDEVGECREDEVGECPGDEVGRVPREQVQLWLLVYGATEQSLAGTRGD